uniref:Uncharacterized protein n=1 Tax=Acrobeloides nanus TaxID=290746 RepID=A0A914DA23_9BILA
MFLAVAVRGGATTGLSDQYTAYETQNQLKDSTSSLILTTSANLDKVLTASKGCPQLKTILVLDDNIPNTLNTSLRILTWNDATSREPIYDRSKISIDVYNDLVAILYSSGTTGLPKGVMLTHFNYVAQIVSLAAFHAQYWSPYLDEDNEMETQTYAIGYLPFYHAFGFLGLCTSLMRGSTMVIIKKYTPELLLSNIEKYKIKSIPTIPALINFLAKSHLVEKYDLSSLRSISSGAGPLDIKTADAVKRRLPHINYVFQAYGMTEMTTGTHGSNLGNKKNIGGTVGIPVPNVECKIINPETGELCKLGESGEIVVRGPTMMKGYWNNEAATREMIDKDGWLHTGDIGYEDEDGNLFINDRIKELIKVKSFQVPPAELEAVILSHPDVQDVAVIGIPDEINGEVPRAFVVNLEQVPVT